MADAAVEHLCSIDNCDAKAGSSGFCKKHYKSQWAKARTAKCSIEDCGRIASSFGWCSMHYRRWRKSGHTDQKAERLCSVPGCNKRHYGQGFCSAHLDRHKRYGDPLAGRAPNGAALDLLFKIALSCDQEDCLIWPFARNPKSGHGVIYLDGKLKIVHRVVCELTYGPPPSSSHETAHSCGKGHEGCYNPKHLSWKTPKENQQDKIIHGTINRGSRNHSTILTETDVRKIRMLLNNKIPVRKIALKFGVTQGAINGIKYNRSWSWLT